MNEMPSCKNIRLKDYDYSSNGAYFVTICTKDKVKLFGDLVGATLCCRPNNPDKLVEKCLIEIESKFENTRIDKHIIMPNHLHFVLFQTGDHAGSPLRDIVGWFKTMTTNEYIRCVKNGLFPPFDMQIWQRNYYEHIIRDEQDYLRVWQYIDENPAKWADDVYFV